MRRFAAAQACVLALGLAGCGEGRHRLDPAGQRVARANATHEYPGPAPPAQHATGALAPQRAVTAFAHAYINWNAGDVAAVMSRLARDSVGQARSEMALAAAETRIDPSIQQGEISNRGAVEAVARLPGLPRRYLVVTREATSSSASGAYRGLAPAWHVTVATVTETGPAGRRRWVISGWQPES